MSNAFKPILAFGNVQPDIYRYTEVYDPDVDGIDPENSGKFIPTVYSFVIDDRSGAGQFTIYQVVAVDETTHKCTLAVPKIPLGGWIDIPEVLTYGRTDYALFYDDRNPERINLNVDSTLLVTGKQLQWFRLTSASYGNVISRPIDSSNRITVATIAARNALRADQIGRGALVLVIDASADPAVGSGSAYYTLDLTAYATGTVAWVRINDAQGMCPLLEVYKTTFNGVDYCLKQCAPCLATTNWTMSKGDQYILEMFDQSGALCIQLQIIAVPGTVLGDQTTNRDPIVDFKVDPPASMGWEIPVGYNMDNYTLTPQVVFASGARIGVPIDNLQCFAYGLSQVEAKAAGKEYPIIFKYWPSSNIPVHLVNADKDVPFLSTTATIKIVEYSDQAVRRISAIPQWADTKYVLNAVVYYQSGKAPVYYSAKTGGIVYTTSRFNGDIPSSNGVSKQEFSYTVTGSTHIEAVKMELSNPSADNLNAPVALQYNKEERYGDGSTDPEDLTDKEVRPVINHYAASSTNPRAGKFEFELVRIGKLADKYLVQNPPEGSLDAARNAKMLEYFLQYYLYNAAANVILINEIPTHFRVVYPDGRQMLAQMPLTSFQEAFSLALPPGADGIQQDAAAVLLGTSNTIGTRFVIVEFLQLSTTMRYLFGVPVYVRSA